MPAPWTDKALKTNPLAAADEFMLLDSSTAVPADINKRVTLSNIQSNLITNVNAQDFNIINLRSLTFANQGAGADTTLSSNSANQEIESDGDISIVKDENGDAKLNLTVFSDAFDLPTIFASRARGTLATPTAVQSGDVLFDADARGHDGTSFDVGGFYGFSAAGTWTGTSHPTNLEFATTDFNAINPVINLTILPEGTADFHGNIITNAILDVELDNGFIHVGNQNNSSESYFAQLETKAECLAATTGNITLANSQTIDGIAVVNPNRVLVKDQTDASENGIYEVVDAGAWTRTTDANTSALVNNGMFTKITFGTVNANTAWVLSTPDPIILDTTDLTIDQFSLADIAHLNSTQTFTGSNSFASDLLLQHPDGDEIDIVGTVFSNSPGDRSEFTGRRARGTPSTPLAVLDGDSLSGWEGIGFDGTQFTSGFSAAILIKADGDWTDAPNRPTRIELRTTLPNGSNVDPRLVVNSLGQTSFEDNPIINIGSILLNDDDDSNAYTILGGALTGDFNVTIPTITANDTFALLGVDQTFTGSNTFTSDILLTAADNAETDIIGIVFSNNAGDSSEFTGRRARGTLASPLPVQDGDFLVEIGGAGFDGNQLETSSRGQIAILAAGTWDFSIPSRPTKITFTTTGLTGSAFLNRVVIGADGETSFQDNPIQDIASILLNDSDNSNKYTILGDNLAGDFNVTIPTITANDTFALLGVDQTFTGENTFRKDVALIKDSDGAGIFSNTVFNNADANGPFFDGFRAKGTESSPLTVDNNTALTAIGAFGHDGTSFELGGLFEFNAAGIWTTISHPTRFNIVTVDVGSTTPVSQFSISPDGTASFEDNSIQDISSILLNDDDDSNAYTILGGALTGDFNVTIPSISASDNFVLSGIPNAYTAGARQDFLGLLAGTSGLNVGGIAGNPTTQVDGDIWLNTSTNTLFGRINGADVDLGSTVTGTLNTVTCSAIIVTDPTTITFGDTVGGVNFEVTDNSPIATVTATVDSGYTGGSSIATVGTITSGIWNGTTVGVTHGGTGNATFTDGGILLGNGIGPITATADLTFASSLLTGLESSDTAIDSFEIRLQRQRTADPEDVLSGDSLGKLTFFGAEDATPNFAEGGRLEFRATENWDLTANGTELEITTTANLTDTPTVRLTIEQDGTANFEGNTQTSVGTIQFNADSGHQITDSATQLLISTNTGDDILLREVSTELFKINEVEGFVASRRIQGFKGADVASATAITLGDGNYFDITVDVSPIDTMTDTNWQAGSVVTLQFDGGVTVTNNSGGTSPNADFVLFGGIDFVATANDTLTLVFDGIDWRETSRSIN